MASLVARSRRSLIGGVVGWIILSAALIGFTSLSGITPLYQPAELPRPSLATVDRAFSGGSDQTLVHVVLESSSPLGAAAHDYYDVLVRRLNSDTDHVAEALGPWTDPLSAPIAESPGGRSSYALVWAVGTPGGLQATKSIESIRQVVGTVAPPPGVRTVVVDPTSGPDFSRPVLLGAVIAVAALVAALFIGCRPLVRFAVIATAPATTLAVAVPLWLLLHSISSPRVSGFGMALAVVVTSGAATEFARLLTRSYAHRRRRGQDSDTALPAAVADTAGSAAAVTAISATLLAATAFARTPALQNVGIPAAIGVVIAYAGSLVVAPAVIRYTRGRSAWLRPPSVHLRPGRRLRRIGWAHPRPVSVLVAAAALVAAGAAGALCYRGFQSPTDRQAAVSADRLEPEIVTIEADHDLRDPQGMIAIDRVTRAIVALPGVRQVRSASWPAGSPWAQASFAHQAGEIGKQLQRNAATITSQLASIKTIGPTLDQLSAAVSRLQTSVTAGNAGLRNVTGAGRDVAAGVNDLRATAQSISGELNPLRDWASTVPNCAADALCGTALRLIQPVDQVVRGVTVLTDGAHRMQSGSADTAAALVRAPQAVTQMQAALDDFRRMLPGLTDTVDSVLPQLVQLTSLLKNVSLDFKDSGEGGFYAPRKLLNDPSYQAVEQSLFTGDGHATRLFVYGDGDDRSLLPTDRPAVIRDAIGATTKFGSLVDAEVAITGTWSTLHTLDTLARHDLAILSTAVILVAVAVAATGVRTRWAVVAALIPVVAFWSAFGALHEVFDPLGSTGWPGLLIAYLMASALGLPHALIPVLGTRHRPVRALLPTVRAAPGFLLCVGGAAFGLSLGFPGSPTHEGPGALIAGVALGLTMVAVPMYLTAIASGEAGGLGHARPTTESSASTRK